VALSPNGAVARAATFAGAAFGADAAGDSFGQVCHIRGRGAVLTNTRGGGRACEVSFREQSLVLAQGGGAGGGLGRRRRGRGITLGTATAEAGVLSVLHSIDIMFPRNPYS